MTSDAENAPPELAPFAALDPTSRAELATLTGEKEIAGWLVRERQRLIELWSHERGGRAWMHAYAALLDTVVRRLFTLSIERTVVVTAGESPVTSAGTSGVAIIAVGGYGQRLCAPHSDLDLTFLSERDDDPPILHQMFPLVMDVLLSGAKIKVGYAYRTLADLRAETLDHQTQTALLDARLLAGDPVLFQRFQGIYAQQLHVADFLFRKEAERARVRTRWGDSPFVVEPNIKEGVGGLRDIQTAAWMARVRFGKGGEALWRDLLRRKVITKADLHTLGDARELLLTTRCALHLLSGERRDVLSARRQEEVAARLGWIDDRPEADALPAVERFMSEYYNAAYSVLRISDKVMARCLDAPLTLGVSTGLSSVRRTVAVTDPARAEADPLWPMVALGFCQDHKLELALPTEEAIERHVESGLAGRDGGDVPPTYGQMFLGLLVQPGGDVTETLRRMERTTLLRTMLPELDRCMGLIPYDSSHSHTVGEHSLRVLANLVRLRDQVPDGDSVLGGYRSILQQLVSPLPLLLSALLHDIGKQWPTLLSGERAGHEETGAERVVEICNRLGCIDSATEQVQQLIRHHLVLARISRLRDLSQPSTISEVIRTINGDRELLRMLYLLTWADTSAVGPGVWSDMQARLLDELFSRTDDALEAGWRATANMAAEAPMAAPDIGDARLHTVRERLQRQLVQDGRRFTMADSPLSAIEGSDDAVRAHVQLMPAVYLLNTPPTTIALHVALIERLRRGDGGPVMDMRTEAPGLATTELTVAAYDAPGLFSRLTGALFACDVGVHRAQAFTRPLEDGDTREVVVDTLTVDHRDRPLGPERRRMVEDALRAVIGGEKTVAQFLVEKRRAGAAASQIVLRYLQVDDQTSPDYTLVDIETADEIGIAYRLAAHFSGFDWNIHAARISTWGGNARCAFYLTDNNVQKLPASLVWEKLEPLVATDGRRYQH